MKKISLILIIVAILIIFKKFFIPGPLVWGDAPYFYPEGLKELFNLPTIWTTRGNSLGNINLFIWIYPIMLVYGFLGSILHLSNDIILRILFYFPSLISGSVGVFLFTKYFKFPKTIQFFSILIYLINTYYLLLADGGQVGVFLSYGFFPLILLLLIKAVDKSSVKNFLIALTASFILTVVDFRISAICIFTTFLLRLPKFKKLKTLLLISICIIGLSSYWIIPAVKLTGMSITTDVSGLKTTSILNTLFLFSPNWPTNEFGKTVAPYFYFSIIPILIFLPLFFKKDKKIIWLTFLFLIFAFLAKGESEPFGFIYSLVVNTKFGSVFRDSTKFFIPLLLFGGILIGKTVEIIRNRYISLLIFVFILFLSWQAIFGKLNGVLGKSPNLSDYQKIHSLISKENGFLRSAWFTEKPPFAFHTEEKQSLDAKDLVNFRPFASMNAGTSDRFNFMNNNEYLDWFDLLGIKYLVFNGNPRVLTLNESGQKDWDRLMNLISKATRLQKLDIDTQIPVYENSRIHSHEFFVDKTFVIIGSDNIYTKLKNLDTDFSIGNQGFLFAEDGKLNPENLQNISSTSAILIFNNKNQDDLKMSFLQKEFISPTKATSSQWAVYSSSDYLKYKYELLTKGISFNDFDYTLGIAFSTQIGEKINFKLNISENGNYTLAIRRMDKKNQNMQWNFQNFNLNKGTFNYSYENKLGFEIINAVALISDSDMNRANQLTKNFLNYFKKYDANNKNDQNQILDIVKSDNWEKLNLGEIKKPGWFIYTDSFNSDWSLQRNFTDVSDSLPMYSAINGFYIDPKWNDLRMFSKGNEYVRWGLYFSVVSFLIITIIIVWKINKQ